MCDYIALIAPSDDVAGLAAVMQRHGRTADPVSIPSLSRALKPGEHAYLTNGAACDCGTALGSAPADLGAATAQEAARLNRKGWSKAKVARAIADSQKSGERQQASWAHIVGDLLTSFPHVGLLVHNYSGPLADEDFSVTRREASGAPAQALPSLRPDELLIFRAR